MATVLDLEAAVAILGAKIEEIANLVAALRASQGGITEAELDAVRAAIAALSVRADEILA
mgnify:CR=1 FL=1